ncbi:hypothetical protein ACLGIH_08435 [Streptomyces sp. HMX87]|uniref:hypothetical protein n=1 Tax=Streptomyces sp. HMX87 TaxID=3390849 RepID=UPI003A856F10
MGVFARLLRRSKATEEAPAAEQRTGAPAPESASEDAADTTEPKGSDGTGDAEASQPAETERPAAAAGSDGVEIPKQQSAGAAVDNEAGEGARS